MRFLRGIALLALTATLVWAVIPPKGTAIPSGTLILPAGTPIRVQLETAISSADARQGDRFAGLVMRSVYLDGHRVIPRGSILEGEVREVIDHRVATGASGLLLRPDFLALPDGRRYHISAQVTAALSATDVRVGDEGMIESRRGMDANNVHWSEAATAGGMATGAIVAGAQAALIGTGVGAGVAVGWWLLSHRHAALNQGAELDVTLRQPVALTRNPPPAPSVGPPRLIRRAASVASAAALAAPGPARQPAAVAPAFQPPPPPTVRDIPAPGSAPTPAPTSH
ncbi:MAG: hypothetical protein ACRD2E_12165 [Terriglobales bacterium]